MSEPEIDLRSPFPWTGDAMVYARQHVDAGVLRVDPDGSIWRIKVRSAGRWAGVVPRRGENVGGKGYLRISLHVAPGHALAIVMAHNLVYVTLVGPIPRGLELDHKDNNKRNNCPDNLEPVTPLENMRRSHERGRTRPWAIAVADGGRLWRRGQLMLTPEQRAHARYMRSTGATLKQIAGELGVAISHAHRITQGSQQ